MDEATLAGAYGPRPGSGAVQAHVPGTTPFLAQIEQVLGEETEPDAAFFVESWTMGVAAASENFLRRQEAQKSREQPMPSWNTFVSFPPFFVPSVEASTEPAWLPRGTQSSIFDEQMRDGQEDHDHAAEEIEIASPLTVDAARRVLGVTAISTREQIRAAYRKMATRYHPDRVAGAEAREQKLAGDRMASINQAYQLLCAAFAG